MFFATETFFSAGMCALPAFFILEMMWEDLTFGNPSLSFFVLVHNYVSVKFCFGQLPLRIPRLVRQYRVSRVLS